MNIDIIFVCNITDFQILRHKCTDIIVAVGCKQYSPSTTHLACSLTYFTDGVLHRLTIPYNIGKTGETVHMV